MGHPQPATSMNTGNSTACGIVNDTVKQRKSKATNKRFYWIRCRSKQNQFRIHWKRGEDNHADYFTKHHTASHHHNMQPRYLHVPIATKYVSCEGVLISQVCTPAGIPPYLTQDTK
jgi:hypothetical protein